MILKKVEGRRNPRAWRVSLLTVSGLHGHPSTPNPRPKRRVETSGDPWGVPQPSGPSSPAYGTPPTATVGTSIGQVSTDCARGGGLFSLPRVRHGAKVFKCHNFISRLQRRKPGSGTCPGAKHPVIAKRADGTGFYLNITNNALFNMYYEHRGTGFLSIFFSTLMWPITFNYS